MKPIKEGKVREIYDNGDSLIMVATDRISCFDVILKNKVTKKGTVLTQMSRFWFDFTKDILPNHMMSTDVKDMPEFFRKPEFDGKQHDVQKAYHASPWSASSAAISPAAAGPAIRRTAPYAASVFPRGLRNPTSSPSPSTPPSTKAEIGDHDENISYEQSIAHLEKHFPGKGGEYAKKLRDYTIAPL